MLHDKLVSVGSKFLWDLNQWPIIPTGKSSPGSLVYEFETSVLEEFF